MESSLKFKNLPILGGYIFGNLWLLYLIILGHVPDLAWTNDVAKLVPAGAAATVIALVFSELLSSKLKARLVFRKRTHPLPGTEAFSKYGPGDPRVDMDVLMRRFGSPSTNALPEEPEKQNALWYKIYKLNESRPTVLYANQYWLLTRDIAAVSTLLFAIMAVAAFIVNAALQVWSVAALLLLAELVLAIGTSASLARDLVCNVLAEESAKADK